MRSAQEFCMHFIWRLPPNRNSEINTFILRHKCQNVENFVGRKMASFDRSRFDYVVLHGNAENGSVLFQQFIVRLSHLIYGSDAFCAFTLSSGCHMVVAALPNIYGCPFQFRFFHFLSFGVHTANRILLESSERYKKRTHNFVLLFFSSCMRITCTGFSFFFLQIHCVRRWLHKKNKTNGTEFSAHEGKSEIEFRERAKYFRLIKQTWKKATTTSQGISHEKCNTFYCFVWTVVVFNFNPKKKNGKHWTSSTRPHNNQHSGTAVYAACCRVYTIFRVI